VPAHGRDIGRRPPGLVAECQRRFISGEKAEVKGSTRGDKRFFKKKQIYLDNDLENPYYRVVF